MTSADLAANEIRETAQENQVNLPNPIPRIKKMTQMGAMFVSFSKPI